MKQWYALCVPMNLWYGWFASWDISCHGGFLPRIWFPVTDMQHYYFARYHTDDWHIANVFSSVFFPCLHCWEGCTNILFKLIQMDTVLTAFLPLNWCCAVSLQWRHNGLDGVSNHQPHHCLLSRLFGRRSKKTSKLRVTGLCAGNSQGTGEFPAQMASNAENVPFDDVIMYEVCHGQYTWWPRGRILF